MKRKLLILFSLIFIFLQKGLCQTFINVDLTAQSDISVTYTGAQAARSGSYCGDNNCVVFIVQLNSGSDLLNITSSQQSNADRYTVNCGAQTPLGTPVCISGLNTATVAFCKPGNNANIVYTITASSSVKASPDITLRQGCTGSLSVAGLSASSVVWKSIYPGATGDYNSYLSCTSGCTTTSVTPAAGAPAYIDYQVSGQVSNCANSRTDVVRVYTVPAMTVALTPASPVICASGGSTTLTATATGGNAPYTYLWSNGATTPSINVSSAGTYTVSVSDNVTSCPPVPQSVTVTAAPTPASPTAAGATICSGSSATVTATAPGGTYQWYSAASGGTPLFTGSSYTTSILTTTTTYYVDVTSAAGCTSTRTPVTVTVNPIPVAPTAASTSTCNGSSATLSANSPSGGTYDWYDSASGGNHVGTGSTFTTLALTANTTYYVQTTVNGCVSSRTAVNVTINPTPAAPTANGASICSGSSVSLSAMAPGGNYQWYDAPTGGNLLISSSTYTTPVLTTTTTYYVQTTVNGCTSARTAVTVTVNPIPVAPTVSNTTICYATTATLSASAPGGTYRWYSSATGGTPLFTGNTYTTSSLTTTTTYYVDATSASGCTGPRAAVTVTVNPLTPAPTVSGVTICNGSTATLTATAPGGAYDWFSTSSGGTSLFTGVAFTTAVLTTTTTYYVQATVNGCTGARTAVTVTVLPILAAPTALGMAICSGSTATLTATAPGGTYAWYDSASGGNLLGSGTSYTTTALTTSTTYYVQTTINGCTSTRTAVTVTVNPLPVAPTAAGATVCQGYGATLTATAPGGTYRWYTSATGGTPLFTGATYTTLNLTTTTTYYVDATSATGCTGPRTAVTVTVTPPVNPAFTYASGTFCQTGTNPTPTIAAPSGGTFSSTTGLVFVDDHTGQIDLAASTLGTYVITFVTNTSCAYSSSSSITITTAPDASFSYTGPYCQFQSNPLPTFTPGISSAGVFSAVPVGLVFLNASTGEIDLQNSLPGTYTVTNTIAASGGCAATSSTNTVTINPTPHVTSVASATICNGTSPNYTITSDVGTTFSWSRPTVLGNTAVNGTSNTINETLINNTTAPVDVVYTIIPTAGSCDGPPFTYTLTVNPTPHVTSLASTTICNGATLNYAITSDVSGTTFSWSRPTVLGNTAISGTSNTINETLINNTTAPVDVVYTIIPSANGCDGTPFTYTVTVNPTPHVTSLASATICNGATLNYAITSDVGTTFNWSRPTVLGNTAISGTSNTINETLINNTTAPVDVVYTIIPTAGSCDGPPFTYTVTVNPTPNITSVASATICNGTSPNYTITSDVGTTFSWSRPTVLGNTAVNGTSNTINETLINNTTAPVDVVYTIIPTAGSCDGPPFTYTVTVNPTPNITSVPTAIICNNTAQNYIIQSNVSGTAFNWSRPLVTGISNGPVSGQTSSTITEALINNTTAPIDVVYTIIPSANGCDGSPFTYTVTVNPTPNITSVPTAIICNNTAQNYIIQSNVSGTTFSWSRPLVTGISNGPVNRTSSTITEALINNTTAPIDVVYTIIPSANGCDGSPFTYTVTVNPTPNITSVPTAIICNNTAQNYAITSNVSGTTFSCSRPLVTGISNGPVNGTSSTITEALSNNTTAPVDVVYTIIPSANGCDGPPFTYTVTVNPTPTVTNTPLSQTVCSQSGSAAVVFTSNISGVTMQWTATASPKISGFAANGTGNLPAQTLINTDNVAGTVDYFVIPYLNGCAGIPVHYIITVNPKPATPVLTSNSPVCQNYALSLTAPTITGATYLWTGPNGFTSTLQNPIISNAQLAAAGQYSLVVIVNGCSSNAGTINVAVMPTPSTPVATSNGPLCEGSTLILTANAIAGATYNWTGPNGFTSTLQNPSVANITTAGGGIYSVTATVNGCTSAAGTINVTVNAIPAAPVVTTNTPVCENNTISLGVNNVPGTTYTWTGPNNFFSNLANPSIPAASQANAGVYTVTATVGNCTSAPTAVTIVVDQTPVNPVASSNSPACSGSPIMLNASTFAGAIYQWTGPNGFSSNLQNPVINSASAANTGTYTVSITAPGCSVTASASTIVMVNQTPVAPTASSNSPVCTGDNLRLTASNVAGAIYSWVGPNGFTSTLQNPVINNVAGTTAGVYSVTVTVNGCTSAPATTNVVISVPKVVFAGNDQAVCANNAKVTLAGTITNDNTGIWTSSGTGTFSPSNTSLTAIYIPSAADITAGNVTLTLSSVNNGGCGVAVSSIKVTISPTPIVNAGGNQSICDNDDFAILNGSITYASAGKWTTSGTGTFSPSENDIKAKYIPSQADKAAGSVKLTLALACGCCPSTPDVMTLSIIPSPTISMPDTKYVLQGESTVLNPVVTGSALQYLWSPAINLSSATVRNPVITGVESQLYTLSVTGLGGCITQKQTMVNVLKPIVIPNTFTPNGDGINDRWIIKELANYPGVQLSVFNRYGIRLYSTKGYDVPWDGNYNGKPVPEGTYYYLIDLGIYGKTLSGYIVVLR